MKARDVMVSPVVTVGGNETVRDVAKLLIGKRISAVPVVDGAGKVIGIVTEADLLHRAEAGTERPVSWWLSLISGDRALADEYVKSHAMEVKDVMTRDVKTAKPTRPWLKLRIFSRRSTSKETRSNREQAVICRHRQPRQHHSGCRKRPAQARNQPIRRHDPKKGAGRAEETTVVSCSQAECHGRRGRRRSLGRCRIRKERQAITVAAQTISGVAGMNDHLIRKPALIY